MNGLELLAMLKDLDLPSFRTQDIAHLAGCTVKNVSHHLGRLQKSGQVVCLKRGLWGFPERIQRWALPGILTAPFPSYVSLYSALSFHGMIEQIPDVIYAVTAGRSARVTTPPGTVSFHNVGMQLMTGYMVDRDTGVAMASPEKALVDTLYLQSSRSPLFHALPEVEIPLGFDRSRAEAFIELIPHSAKRASTLLRFRKLLGVVFIANIEHVHL